MNKVVHKSNTRGHANHGWLNSYHTFSFGGYYDQDRMGFGALRVLNDDTVAPGRGFGTHPHDNMEIVSIPLMGDLEHKDSMGTTSVIRSGDIQVMSAGTGVSHSEYNASQTNEVKFLQIWIFPREKNVKPRYDQQSLKDIAVKNRFYQVLSPDKDDQGVWINQDAWFSMGDFEKGHEDTYQLKNSNNGVYLFVLEGEVRVEDLLLSDRDGLALTELSDITVKADTDTKFLMMEVPMHA